MERTLSEWLNKYKRKTALVMVVLMFLCLWGGKVSDDRSVSAFAYSNGGTETPSVRNSGSAEVVLQAYDQGSSASRTIFLFRRSVRGSGGNTGAALGDFAVSGCAGGAFRIVFAGTVSQCRVLRRSSHREIINYIHRQDGQKSIICSETHKNVMQSM